MRTYRWLLVLVLACRFVMAQSHPVSLVEKSGLVVLICCETLPTLKFGFRFFPFSHPAGIALISTC